MTHPNEKQQQSHISPGTVANDDGGRTPSEVFANVNLELNDLRSLLARYDYVDEHVAEILGAADIRHVIANPAIYAYLLESTDPELSRTASGMLVQLFILNRRLPCDLVERALGAELASELTRKGLLARGDESSRGTVSITPFKGQLFLSDQIFTSTGQHQVEKSPGIDLCMPPHASSLITLDGVPQLGSRLLDIGCGSGFIGMVAHSADVQLSGIDLNERCVDFAKINAAINDVPADFEKIDYQSHSPGDSKYTDIVFNAPGLPDAGEGSQELGVAPPQVLIADMAKAVSRLVVPGGKAHINVLIEMPSAYASTTEVVESWLHDSDVSGFSVLEPKAPEFAVTRKQIERGRLSGRTLLVSGPAEGTRVMENLRRRGIVEIVPAIVTLTA